MFKACCVVVMRSQHCWCLCRTSDEHISIAQFLKASSVDGAIIVTTPQEVSIIDVRKEINFCKKANCSRNKLTSLAYLTFLHRRRSMCSYTVDCVYTTLDLILYCNPACDPLFTHLSHVYLPLCTRCYMGEHAKHPLTSFTLLCVLGTTLHVCIQHRLVPKPAKPAVG